MKAAVIYENGGPDVLRYEDLPDPECPDGCVLIDVEAISIEGGDLLHRAGSPPASVPHIVGYLAAGTVVEVGAGVEDRAVGDRVVTLNSAGSHASKRAGATVIATASDDGKLERLKEFGLDHGINYASENFVERTRELTDGRGVEVILDSVGGQNLIDSIGALAYRGTLVSVGVAGRAGSTVEARDLWGQNNALRGVFLGGALLTEYPRVHGMIDLFERIAAGDLRVEIDRTFPLAQAAAAHAYIESRRAFGRVVMTP